MTTEKKTHYHSTVSRRDFMKKIGLGTVGVGALSMGVSMAEPFKDLDEMMGHPAAKRTLPIWVKEVDKPTVEIDWDNLKSWQISQSLFVPKNWPPGEYQKIVNKQVKNVKQNVKAKTPQHSLRDYAMANAAQWGAFAPDWSPPFDGPDLKTAQNKVPQHPLFNYGAEDLKVPKWKGTPEEASQMLRVFGRLFGAADMGFLYLDDKIKKLLYSDVHFEDVEKGYEEPGPFGGGLAGALMGGARKVLPNKDLWVITSLMPQSMFQSRNTVRGEWGGSNFHAYSRTAVYANKIMVFLKSLGYEAYGSATPTLGSNVGFGVMSGLAEYCRTSQMVSPIFGNTFRTVFPIITNLPLAVTKPIDAGILEFCRTCKKCAAKCPSGALSIEDEPFWGGHDGPYQRPGIKGYYTDMRKCFAVMFSDSPDCGVCQSVCPFSKFNKASIHEVIKATIGFTPTLNQVIAKMDDVFGYGMKNYNVWEMDQWDIPLYGLDPSRL